MQLFSDTCISLLESTYDGSPSCCLDVTDPASIAVSDVCTGCLASCSAHCQGVEHLFVCADIKWDSTGNNTNSSFTDFIGCKHGRTDLDCLSGLVDCVVEVEGDWQLDLPPGLSLADALLDERHHGDCLQALQQVSRSQLCIREGPHRRCHRHSNLLAALLLGFASLTCLHGVFACLSK